MDLREKFLITFGESMGMVLGYAILYGAVWYIIKSSVYKLLSYIGIEYYLDKVESYKWIGQYIIEARAVLNADRVAFYRTFNGRSYILNTQTNNKGFNVKSIINKTKNKGIYPLPDTLNLSKYQDWFDSFKNIDYLQTFFQRDFSATNTLRNSLNKMNIESFLAIKVLSPDKTELYGFVVFTWSDIKSMPMLPDYDKRPKSESLRPKSTNLEYIESLTNSIYSELEHINILRNRKILYSLHRLATKAALLLRKWVKR